MHQSFQSATFDVWFLRVAILAIFSICVPAQIHAQSTYPKIEASFTVNTPIADPFDYSNDVRVLMVQPDAGTISLPAFFDGGSTWRVRHTPTMAGVYSISNITLNGSPLSFGNLSPASWTVTGFPTSPGFVGVDPTNPRRFVTSNGRRYFPVGQDVAWGYTNYPSGDYRVTTIFPKMGAAHENWSRVWMTHFYDSQGLGLNLDWPKVNNTFGQLNLTNARNWDAIVAAADQAGIHFQMVLQHHGQYSSTNGSDVNPNWEQNPYNVANGGFLTNATNFFTDPTAASLTKRKLHYIVARWGYSPAIMAFELFNEVQYTDAGYANQWSNIEAWHNEMAQFIRTNDVYHHLITSSSDLTEPIWDQTDYYQHHDYPSDLITGIRDAQDIAASQPVAPDFSGECGIDYTPHVGVSPPVWAGLMAAQSGGAQPWYWDTIDPNNDYFLIQAAADFVTVSGLADENALTKSIPQTTGGGLGPLTFSPGGGWVTNTQSTYTIGDAAPAGIGSASSYLQGYYHSAMTSNGYTFLVNYPQNGTFSLQVLQIASSGAGLEIFLDGNLRTNIAFPSAGSDTSTNFTASIPVSAGSHSINITNNGLDWILLGNITLNPYVSALGAYAIGTNNWQALWLWNRTNVFAATPGPSVTGTVAVAGLDPGTYAGTWWDTFGAGAVSNFTFTVTGSNVPVTLATPTVLRSLALYVGIPAQAGIIVPNLTQTAASNAPPFNVPLVITNSGGLPLAYSLSSTSAIPAWLSFSSTNGYVSESSALTVYLAFNPAGLAPGTYTCTLFVNTSDPLQPVTPLPVSFTVSSGTPTAPQLQVVSWSTTRFVFQLLGDTNVTYVVQNSTDLMTWVPVSTNTLPGGILNITNAIPPGASRQFWRALWQP
ncbi:MAG: DUF5060 domain-containing protein [Limisphaerales bacterium]